MGQLLSLYARDGRPIAPPATPLRRYLIEIARPDGTHERSVALGGSGMEHAAEAMERGGLGSVVRIQPVPLHLTEAA